MAHSKDEARRLLEEPSGRAAGDFLLVEEALTAEPQYSHKEILALLVKSGHATEVSPGTFKGRKRLFKPEGKR